MGLPASITPVAVTCSYMLPSGDPATGTVSFTPSIPAATAGAVMPVSPVTVTLDSTGSLSVILAATDDPQWAASGFTYEVVERIYGAPKRVYDIEVPAASPGGTLDLASVVPVVAANSVSQYLLVAGGTMHGDLVVDDGTASRSVTLKSYRPTDDIMGGTDGTSRLNLESLQRANYNLFGEVIRIDLRKLDAKGMIAWRAPSGGYDGSGNPVGNMKSVTWIGSHWQANDHGSNHVHWELEIPDSTGALQGRLEVPFANATSGVIGLDKTNIKTNLADLTVRCSNGQVLRLSSANANNKDIVFALDTDDPAYRRWALRATSETESGGNAGSNWQLVRYDDTGTFVDSPIVVSRSTGNVTLGPGFIARRAASGVSSVSLNTTSLGGGLGVIGIGNANTVPTTNPSSGGVLYAEGGALKWRGPSGTVTTLGVA